MIRNDSSTAVSSQALGSSHCAQLHHLRQAHSDENTSGHRDGYAAHSSAMTTPMTRDDNIAAMSSQAHPSSHRDQLHHLRQSQRTVTREDATTALSSHAEVYSHCLVHPSSTKRIRFQAISIKEGIATELDEVGDQPQTVIPNVHRRSDFEWCPRKSILFIVNCKPLAMVANGRSPCQPQWSQAWLTDKLLVLMNLGFAPKEISEDFIQWRPRGENVRADSLCNVAMGQEVGMSWKTKKSTPQTHFIVHSDGPYEKLDPFHRLGFQSRRGLGMGV